MLAAFLANTGLSRRASAEDGPRTAAGMDVYEAPTSASNPATPTGGRVVHGILG
jgi:hypothetical protein